MPKTPDLPVTEPDLDEQRQVRRSKRERMLAEGKAPYPTMIGRTHTLAEIRETYAHLEAGEETQDVVGVAGRVIFVRNTGKLCFATLQDGQTNGHRGTRLQVMLSLAEVGEDSLAAWKSLVDLGDHVFVEGRVICSKRGELSVMATRWEMASKALRPLPVLHKELSEESRVRQRYADLIVRQEARDMVRTRAAITSAVRRQLEDEGFLEIETPVLQLIHGGAHARPFRTHMNAFDQEMTLRIALELNLKKAVVGGVDKVFEIGRIFRNEGVDSTHSPEFTMVEAYEAYGDQFTIAEVLKRLFLAAADAVGTHQIETPAGTIDLDGEWRWLPVYQGVSEAVGQEITPDTDLETLRNLADKHEVEYDAAWPAQKLVMELCGELVEPHLLQPTFLCDFPALAQPLARLNDEEPRQVLAWDLIIGGVERGTGFTELIDPMVQREILTQQSLLAAGGDPEAMQLDEDFLRALEYGAPPMGGLGFGMDRLVMLFTGAGIRETILFPLLKPEA
ncbi:lysine--tRNA ligase [Nocardioides sp. DS6]|uniref:Lysine--tRNA ligase n=1 Tax=Nocardioides eburneus TaxID=3231482 RepID=A0ABV3SW57_9ACTN